jgi:hypothetical protein
VHYRNGFGSAVLLALGLLLAACGARMAGPTPLPTALLLPTATLLASSPAPLPSAGFGVASPAATVAAGAATAVPGRQPTPLPLSPTPTLALGQVRSLTLDDSGKTINLRVGARFLLNLGEGYDWTVEIGDPSVLARVADVPIPKGAQGWFEARQPGSTTLSAMGDPPCRKIQPPCLAPSRLFQATVIVQ